MVKKYIRVEDGITLIEILLVLALITLVTVSIFPIFFFGNNTYTSGKMQYDIQSDIRLASDIIRDRVRYVSGLDVIPFDPDDPFFDPSSADNNFNYIYLADDEKSIKFKEENKSPVDIINSGSYDAFFDLEFIKGSDSGNVIRFSNSIAAMSSFDQVLKYNIIGESTIQNKEYEVETEVILLNQNSQLPDLTYVQGPEANPPEGEVPYGTTVSLSTPEIGASIYYTVNGDTPSTSSNEYENPISIESAITLKAIAVKDGVSSSVAIYEYTIASSPPSASNVTITGNDNVGDTLEVTYTYLSLADPQIEQGSSIINWYRASKKIGDPSEVDSLIHTDTFSEGDESTRQYTTVSGDKGYYIYVEIIPKDNNSTIGSPAWSTVDFGKIK